LNSIPPSQRPPFRLRVEDGSLYPALHRMQEDGWIRAEWITKDTGRRARMYKLTAAGKKQLAPKHHAASW
jgi:DNA-binding PadR family transcriptional regulator